VCHRDLKPDNIIISDLDPTHPQLTIIDFNVSVDTKKTDDLVHSPTGVKEWSAPETRSQKSYGLSRDVWSVGCLIYYMYSDGQNPFSEITATEDNIK
jgi:serine/threonine protein kinase